MKIIYILFILLLNAFSINLPKLQDKDLSTIWKKGCQDGETYGCHKKNKDFNPCLNSAKIECKEGYKGLIENKPL